MRSFTFNILSSSYANIESYPSLGVDTFKDFKRWPLISNIIQTEMNLGSVISLQEVTEFHRNKLEIMAYRNNYHIIGSNYGHFFSGYMGVVTLFPRNYDLVKFQLFRPSSLVRKFLPATEQPQLSMLSTNYWNPWGETPKVESYQEILGRMSNVQIMIVLKSPEGNTFAHTNYHAPCVYWAENMSEAASALSLHSAQTFAGDLPLVVTGDYNVTPGQRGYNIITGQKFRFIDPNLEKALSKITITPMVSSYLAYNNQEPEFTVNTLSKSHFTKIEEAFRGTLDYIFVSKHWNVTLSQTGPDIETYIPSTEHPSDHKFLYSEMEIINS